MPPLCLDLQKNKKCFVFWLSGPNGTSNFDHQSLIHSDLNYAYDNLKSGIDVGVDFLIFLIKIEGKKMKNDRNVLIGVKMNYKSDKGGGYLY